MTNVKCIICNDSGWEKVDKDGKIFLKKCKCQKNISFINKCRKANIPPRFIGSKLNGLIIKKGNEKLANTVKIMEDYVTNYLSIDEGILLQGNTGVGKTRILCSIASQIIETHPHIDLYYIDWNDLVREMKSGESHTFRDFFQINELIEKLSNVTLLIMDELGASEPSQWVRDNIYYILNYRYNRKKITLFATNYFDETSDGSPTLKERIGDRIRSRIFEMAKPIVLTGQDYRQTDGKAYY